MYGHLSRITAPTIEPLTVDETKLHLRVETTDDQYLIDTLITAAREYVEHVTNRALFRQTWELALDDWPCCDYICIPRPPLISVTSLKWKDTAAVETTVATTEYIVDTEVETGVNPDPLCQPGRIVLGYQKVWPTTALYPASPIRLRFLAGYDVATAGDQDAIPQSLKQAMLLLVGHWYEHREDVLSGNIGDLAVSIPLGVQALLANYRVAVFG